MKEIKIKNITKLVSNIARDLLFFSTASTLICNTGLTVSFDKKSPEDLPSWIKNGCRRTPGSTPLENPQIVLWGIGEDACQSAAQNFINKAYCTHCKNVLAVNIVVFFTIFLPGGV
jgi:hypothetical protein